MSESARPDPARLRISDHDRHQVAEVLREAAGEGRLDLEELDERLEATYAAKTYADLVPITLDLPAHPHPTTPAVRPAAAPVPRPASGPVAPLTRYDTSVAVMSGVERRGPWEIGESHTAVAIMGGVEIDLREVRFTAHETVIYASAVMGGVDIVVNAHTRVVVEGIGIMGGYDQGRDKIPAELTAASPVVRIKGIALVGGVGVVRKGPDAPRRSRWSLGHDPHRPELGH